MLFSRSSIAASSHSTSAITSPQRVLRGPVRLFPLLVHVAHPLLVHSLQFPRVAVEAGQAVDLLVLEPPAVFLADAPGQFALGPLVKHLSNLLLGIALGRQQDVLVHPQGQGLVSRPEADLLLEALDALVKAFLELVPGHAGSAVLLAHVLDDVVVREVQRLAHGHLVNLHATAVGYRAAVGVPLVAQEPSEEPVASSVGRPARASSAALANSRSSVASTFSSLENLRNSA